MSDNIIILRKIFVSIFLQSVVLNLLYSRIGLASELNLSNQLEQHLNKLIGLI